MKKILLPFKKLNLWLILLMTMSVLVVGSCKKEITTSKEKIDPEHLKKIHSYQNGNKLSTINFTQFKSKANLQSLGALKDIFSSPNASKGKLMSVNIPETYNGFEIQTDSIKVLNANGHTSYIFPVKLSSTRAVTFQNLTIDESATGTIVFVNTYKPTQKWIADWKAGKAGKFEGDISVSYLSGGQNLQTFGSSLNSNGKIASINNSVGVFDANGCNVTTYYFELAYNCGSGNHGPYDSGCYLTGEDAAGIALISFDVTVCGPSNTGGGGGGSTTPNPPGDYNPCGGGTPPVGPVQSNVNNGAMGGKLMVAENNPCDETTLPTLPDEDPVNPPKEIKNNLTDPCLNATISEAISTNKDVKGFLSDLINKYAVPNNGIVINISNGNIPKTAQTTSSFTNNTFTANIVFQNGYYNDVSKEAVIAALIHEVVHAYLLQTNNTYRSQPEAAQHNYLFTNYVHDIGIYLISKYNMPHNDAYGLAWSGMGDLYNNAPDNKAFETSKAIPASPTSPAIPAKTMTKAEIGGAVAPYKRIDMNPKGTPNCP